MDTPKLFILICYCSLSLRTIYCQLEESEGWNSEKFKEEAAQTLNLVFHKYNHRVRPPQPFIEILTTVSLRHIRHLDLQKQELQTVLDIEMMWNDTRLQWYPVKVHQINMNASNVWTPDIVYTNSVAETKVLYPSAVRIGNKGFVTWTKKEVVTTLCLTQPDVVTQNCQIKLGFMSNSRIEQTDRFFSNLSSFSLHGDFTNHEWSLVDTELALDIGNLTNRASSIEIGLWLQRRSKVTDGQTAQQLMNDGANQQKSTDHCLDTDKLSNRNRNSASCVVLNVSSVRLIWFTTVLAAIPSLFFLRR